MTSAIMERGDLEYELTPQAFWGTTGPQYVIHATPRQQQQMEGEMKLIIRGLAGWSLACVLALPALAVDPIRIGVVDELTGPQAEAGVLVMRGIKLATDEVNAAGGIMGHPIAATIPGRTTARH